MSKETHLNEEKVIGRNAVIEALKTGSNISKIYILFSAHGGSLNEIQSLSKRQGIPVTRVDSKHFAELTSGLKKDESAQGVVATLSKISFVPIESIVQTTAENKFPFLLVLDRIQDPHNFGAILRTAAFFKADGVVIAKEEQAPLNETVIKASAGGAFHVKIARETNLHQALMYMKEKGFWIASSSVNAPLSIYEMDFKIPVAVVIGNEGSGVKRILRDKSDMIFSIPQIGRIDSLNVSVATGVICYEISRQRGITK
ncbi:MAG: 23S rRNA (guanosine(2251)-2'-O)-methyltransferase RlmB [Bacteroidetes bacterium]|nr:23S rRNA (guanosine(2251)-2'-O)-methyltransferase RlmB [Bacteroidota bacterium]